MSNCINCKNQHMFDGCLCCSCRDEEFQICITELEDKAMVVKKGTIDMPPYSDKDTVTGETRTDITHELAYYMGFEMGILVCGEILSKPPEEDNG